MRREEKRRYEDDKEDLKKEARYRLLSELERYEIFNTEEAEKYDSCPACGYAYAVPIKDVINKYWEKPVKIEKEEKITFKSTLTRDDYENCLSLYNDVKQEDIRKEYLKYLK